MFISKNESCLDTSEGALAPAFALETGAADVAEVSTAPFSEERLSSRGSRTLAERLVITSLLCDSAVILCALVAGFWVRFFTVMRHYGVIAKVNFADYAGYIACGCLLLVLMLAYFQVYERHKLLQFRKVAMVIIKATLLWYVGFLGFSVIFKFQPPISRVFVSISAFNALTFLLVWRCIFHRVLAKSSIATSLRQRILFVGWNEESERLARSFDMGQMSSYEVAGCVASMNARFRYHPHVPVLGEYQDIAQLMHRHGVDIVILADLNVVKGEVVGLANLCEREMVQFKVIPSYFQILISGLELETVSGIPVLGVSQLPLDRTFNVVAKRLTDAIGALIGLAISVPLIAIFGSLVYLESPGPIFYRQRRMGRNGESFDIIKIRSMRMDAEKETGARWAQRDDPRRLRIGAFMRAWNIDEIPQFWNVLKGEMSLVGPRPERPELIANFKQEIPHYNARHNVKPGITGWAQVKGLRGDTDLTERIRADLFYLENWNIMLDLQIMLMTFFQRDNAY